MYIRTCYFVTIIAVLLTRCSAREKEDSFQIVENGKSLRVALEKNGATSYIKCYDGDSLRAAWPLRYPVYRFLKGDVNNDGKEDIAVGVIKTVRGDSVKRKRLFLFEVRNRAIIPMWLGSRLGRRIEDFTIKRVESKTVVRSIEIEDNGNYLVAEYEWFGFGLSFNNYIRRDISLSSAQDLLNE